MNLADLLSRQAKLRPSETAVISGRVSMSFERLDGLVWTLAGVLRGQGIAPGQVVGLAFADEVQHLVAALALIRIGAVQIALSLTEPDHRHEETRRRAGVCVVLTGTETLLQFSGPVIAINFKRLAAEPASIDERVRSGGLTSTFMLNMGSGTTGRPKLMALSSERHLQQGDVGLGQTPIRPGERLLMATPISFTSSKKRRLYCLWRGGTNVFLAPGETIFGVCEALSIDHLRLAASQAATLLQSRGATWAGQRFPHLKSFCIGSSTVSEELRARARERLTENVFVTYATSETGVVSAATADIQARHPGSVGQPLNAARIEVVDGDGRVLPAGEVGEIRIRSPGMIDGYVDDPEATAAVFRDGWFYPRDLGAFADDGVLIFHGRADDMMILDGINIFPREIELALEAHPQVREALAFPIPHPVHNEIPAALVAVSGAASEAELIAFCRERIGLRAPRGILLVPEIPERIRGKVRRRDLFRILETERRQSP